ncbi:MAG: hypothetical protein P9C55_07530 [Defluviicoccus sp.]|nr:hypothetical protein [Defluviicoccus sp.]
MKTPEVNSAVIISESGLSQVLRFHLRESIVFILFLVFLLLMLLFKPVGRDFISYFLDLFESVVRNGTGRALLALGAGLVLASAGVDMSMAGTLTFVGVLFAWSTNNYAPQSTTLWLFFSVPAASLLGGIIGSFNGWAIGRWRSPPLILTWSVGAILLVTSALASELLPNNESVPNNSNRLQFAAAAGGIPISQSLSNLISGAPALLSVVAGLFIVLPFCLAAFNVDTNARAVGANRISATYAGIRVNRTLIITYATSGAFAALAGVWFTLLERKALTASYSGIELSAIAISVLGGTAMSGGYFCPRSIICAAFFWSLLLSGLQRPDWPISEYIVSPFQSRAAEAVFALLLIVVVIVLGRKMSGDAVPINVTSRVGENR